MPIAVSCPECGKAYQLPEDSLGRKATCKACGNAFRVQTGTEAAQTSRSVGQAASASKSRISSSDTLPAQIGRFQILAKLGAGAFGTVYKAYDPVLEREVAVKVPNPGLLSSERDKQRYLREPKAAGQLHHPNIVPVFEASLDGDNIFIVSAFIKGRTLEKAIEEKRPDLRRAATLVMKLARALQYAHENGIVHRDVKPANIMLDAKGEPLLMDFGLARIQESAEKLTMNEAVLGTPAYMSPEQASHNNENVGPTSDQYSLGVILFEMLCGQRPFSGPASIVISLVIKQEPPAPRSLNPKLPRDLETICLKAMAKEPKKRFVDCQELADDLERWLQDEPILARRTTLLDRSVRWMRRNPLVAGLTGVVGVLMLLVAIISSFAAVQMDREKRRASQKAEEATNEKQLAEINARDALNQKQTADANAKEARDQARRADDQTDEANHQRELATRERDRRIEESRRAFNNHYIVQMNLAQTDWEIANLGRLKERLDHTLPDRTGGVDLRGFEWYLWNTRINGHLVTISNPKQSIGYPFVTPDNKELFLCTDANPHRDPPEKTIAVWEASTGKPLRTIIKGAFSIVNYSTDGTLVLTANVSQLETKSYVTQTASIWNTKSGENTATINTKHGWTYSLDISSDNKLFLTAGSSLTERNTEITIWETATSQKKLTLFSKLDATLATDAKAIFSPDSRRVLGRTQNELFLWDTKSAKQLWARRTRGSIKQMAFSQDGRRVAAVEGGRDIRLYNAANGETIIDLKGHTDTITTLGFSPDDKSLISASSDNTIRLWDTTTWKEKRCLKGHNSAVWGAAFSKNGKRIVSVGDDYKAKVWDSEREIESILFKSDDGEDKAKLAIQNIAFGKNGNTVYSVGQRAVVAWDITASDPKVKWKRSYEGSEEINSAISSDGERIVIAIKCGNSIAVEALSAVTGDAVTVFEAMDSGPNRSCRVSCNANGKIVSTVRDVRTDSAETEIKLWDTDAHREIRLLLQDPTYVRNQWSVRSVAFSPDGESLVGIAGNSLCRWSPNVSDTVVKNYGDSLNGPVAFSGDGLRIAVGGGVWVPSGRHEGMVKVVDSKTGDEVSRYKGHARTVVCLAFSPDGKRIASASLGPTPAVKIWDPISGEEFLALTEYSSEIRCIAFSDNGHRIVIGGDDGTIKIWDASDKK